MLTRLLTLPLSSIIPFLCVPTDLPCIESSPPDPAKESAVSSPDTAGPRRARPTSAFWCILS